MTELMSNERGEVIYDRSREHLGTTDVMCIIVRRLLVNAAKAFASEGKLPANVDNVKLDHVRHATGVLPNGADWIKATEEQRSADSGQEIAAAVGLF
jgi:hypothetical protein